MEASQGSVVTASSINIYYILDTYYGEGECTVIATFYGAEEQTRLQTTENRVNAWTEN